MESEAESSSEKEAKPAVKKRRIYKRQCAIKSCNFFAPNGYFSFPTKDFMRKKWIKACGLNSDDVKTRDQLCSEHFHDYDVIPRTQ